MLREEAQEERQQSKRELQALRSEAEEARRLNEESHLAWKKELQALREEAKHKKQLK